MNDGDANGGGCLAALAMQVLLLVGGGPDRPGRWRRVALVVGVVIIIAAVAGMIPGLRCAG